MFTKRTTERFKSILTQQRQEIENLLRTLNHVYRSLDNPSDHKEFMEIKEEHEYRLKCVLSDIEYLEHIQSSQKE